MLRRWLLALVLCPALGRAVPAHRAHGEPVVRTLTLPTMPLDVALDPASGHALVSFLGPITTTPVGGGVTIIDVRRGRLLRSITLPDHPNSVAVDEDTGRGFAATIAGFVTLDMRTGALVQRRSQSFWPGGEVIVDRPGGVAYIAGLNWVAVFDARSGRLRRTIARPGNYTDEVHLGARLGLTLDEFGPISRLRLLVPGRAPISRWLVSGPSALPIDPASAHLLVSDPGRTGARGEPFGDGSVQVRDLRGGALIRSLPVGRWPLLPIVDARTRRAFVPERYSDDVRMLDPRTGTLLRRIRVGNEPVAAALDDVRGRVYVVNNSLHGYNFAGPYSQVGSVSVLDARTGDLITTVPVGVGPRAIAVDPASGRVIVVNSGVTLRGQTGVGSLSLIDLP